MLNQNILVVIATLLMNTLLASAFSATGNNNVALYWGQNSNGNQQSLGETCSGTAADIIILSFLSGFPTLILNFANACETTSSDGVLHCPQIAADIKTCQSLGKKVLLSMGGASGAYGLTSTTQAQTFATTLWNKFGGGTDTIRPFDDAIIDGFDFDIENGISTGYAALASSLRTYFDADSSKTYYLSAAPQCPYPDASIGDALASVGFDFAFIQFYNNYCSLDKQFNWDTWTDYATSTSPNKNIKLYIGLPGSSAAAGSGYVSASAVAQVLTSSILNDANFGGISLWDAASGESNVVNGVNFIQSMKNIVDGASSVVASSAVATPVSSSAAAVHTVVSSSAFVATTTASSSAVAVGTTSSSPFNWGFSVSTSSPVYVETSSTQILGATSTVNLFSSPAIATQASSSTLIAASPSNTRPVIYTTVTQWPSSTSSTLRTQYVTAKATTVYATLYVTSTASLIATTTGIAPVFSKILSWLGN